MHFTFRGFVAVQGKTAHCRGFYIARILWRATIISATVSAVSVISENPHSSLSVSCKGQLKDDGVSLTDRKGTASRLEASTRFHEC